LFLVGALALLAEWRSTEGALVQPAEFLPRSDDGAWHRKHVGVVWHAAARSPSQGRQWRRSLAFAALYLQLSAIGRATTHASIQRLRRFTGAAVAVSLVAGVLSVATPWIVAGEVWKPGSGYVPTFGPALLPLFGAVVVVVTWTVSMVVAIYRHGSARQRREVAWNRGRRAAVRSGRHGAVGDGAPAPRPTDAAVGADVAGGGIDRHARRHGAHPAARARGARFAKVVGRATAAARGCGRRQRRAELPRLLDLRRDAHAERRHGALSARRRRDARRRRPWPDAPSTIASTSSGCSLGRHGSRLSRAHLKLGVPVALKLLNADLAADRRTVERFAREARAAMRIRSVHVVTVHDFGEIPPGIPFLTMEVIEGVSLNVLLADGARLTAPSVALLAVQLARGLVAAHAEGVIHRDLKPDNVLIVHGGAGDVAKVVDFGLAKIIGEQFAGAELTTMGRVFGTPAYISPSRRAAAAATPRATSTRSASSSIARARAKSHSTAPRSSCSPRTSASRRPRSATVRSID